MIMIRAWHWLVHATGCDYGAPYGRFVPYDFWSGLAGSFLVAIVVWLISYYSHHTCHTWWCPRRGLYDFTDTTTGIIYKLCRICHPVHNGERLTRKRLVTIHLGNQRGPG